MADDIQKNDVLPITVTLTHRGDLARQSGEKHGSPQCDRLVKTGKKVLVYDAANIFGATHGRYALNGFDQFVFNRPVVRIDRAGHATAVRDDILRQDGEHAAGCRFRPDIVRCHDGVARAFAFQLRQATSVICFKPSCQNRPCLGWHVKHQKRFETFYHAVDASLYARASLALNGQRLPLAVVNKRLVDIHAFGVLDEESIHKKDILAISHPPLESVIPYKLRLRQYVLHPIVVAVQSVGIGRAGHAFHRAGNRLDAIGKRSLLLDALDRRIGEIGFVALTGAEHDLRRLGMKEVVRIKEPNVFAGHMFQPLISRARNPAVFLSRHYFDAGVFLCILVEHLR